VIEPRNIRSRLALGYAIAVAVTVLIYAGVVYVSTRSTLMDQLDAKLHDDFEREEHAFEIAVDGTLSWKEVRRRHADESPEAPWTEVTHPKGGADLRWPPESGAGPFRIYERDYTVAGGTYHIRVGRSMAPMHAELSELLWLLALCFVPVVGLAWLVGHLLARRALRPIDVMTERARHIGAERLSERLPVVSDDELGRLATVFNEAFARIEGSFERLRGFTSDAAHELRTPLAALRTVGEVGLGGSRDAEAYRDVIASMLEETGRLTRLVEELLELSRGDARSAPIAREPVDVVALVQSVCNQLDVLAAERKQELIVEGDEQAVVPGDAGALRRAITNLVDNAIRHGPAAAPVRVRIKSENEAVVLSVEDEGPGIPAQHRKRIFDRFYRADPARAGTATGLGLSLAAQAAEAHGGRIELETRPAGGTVFRVTLPSSV